MYKPTIYPWSLRVLLDTYGYFHILSSVNTATKNLGEQASVWTNVFVFFLNIYPAVELLNHMVVLLLGFWDASVLFPTMAVPVYIPSNSVQGFMFLHLLDNTGYLCSFWWQPFWRCGDTASRVWLTFPWWQRCDHPLTRPLAVCISSLKNHLLRSSAQF